MLKLSILLGILAALADVAGGLVLVRAKGVERYLRYFVALGAGFLMATALLVVRHRQAAARRQTVPALLRRLRDEELHRNQRRLLEDVRSRASRTSSLLSIRSSTPTTLIYLCPQL